MLLLKSEKDCGYSLKTGLTDSFVSPLDFLAHVNFNLTISFDNLDTPLVQGSMVCQLAHGVLW